jgi:hypothetical protein
MNKIEGFEHFPTHHCVTGSMRHIYAFYGHPLSEELLLGLGEGVGFIYWHQKGQPPFVGGRATPKPSMEAIAGQRTGVDVTPHTTTSANRAATNLRAMLDAGAPVMLQVDMGFLPYFDFGGEYHFGGHVIVACGYDPATDEVLIADREDGLHPVPMADLAKARGSKFKPFPPKNAWWTFDFTHRRMPTPDEIDTAIRNQAAAMLEPPISNFGVKGIRKTAKLLPGWADQMDAEALQWTLFNLYIFISPVGGSGGGMFRYMFSRFLAEAADLTGNAALHDCAADFQAIGDAWEAVGEWAKIASEAIADADLMESRPMLENIAAMEERAWSRLREAVPDPQAALTGEPPA